jgi:hypothetical protein
MLKHIFVTNLVLKKIELDHLVYAIFKKIMSIGQRESLFNNLFP